MSSKVSHIMEPIKSAFILRQFSNKPIFLIQLVTGSAYMLLSVIGAFLSYVFAYVRVLFE